MENSTLSLTDPHNIFNEIVMVLTEELTNKLDIYAFGSRTNNYKRSKGKKDFDILIMWPNPTKGLKSIKEIVDNYFSGRVDEHGKPIKVDIFMYKDSKMVRSDAFYPLHLGYK